MKNLIFYAVTVNSKYTIIKSTAVVLVSLLLTLNMYLLDGLTITLNPAFVISVLKSVVFCINFVVKFVPANNI